MSHYLATTQDGSDWVPQYISSIDSAKCIGCGRCYKVCSRTVLDLVEFETNDDDYDDDYNDFDDDEQRMVMSVASPGDCIGCEACARVCSKNCISHAPKAL
ncbi:ferredoxin III, nif-specific [Aestuariirhabdus litorea]|uniref:Ferredoxin III, nif-specific n=1 Tax=Aestuariirhabdus litorea TaxID=2528527 RepID=A0A3P3VJM8_9GAMM|nr:ferredoxin III, nif-specific [Aestuariirhabdus litorea]RRJ82920.1 ferredoxin III, nif-specific [Aestuariirhabdus litorea]RWW93079.1 ferredoxin III, nif-specific [Endozoicomonadaceae bacterium GTF-13]